MRPRWLVPAFVLAVVLTLVFSGVALRSGAALSEPGVAQVEGWMTPRLAAYSYGVDPAVLAGVLGADWDRGQTLDQMAAGPGDDLVGRVEAVLRAAARP